LAKSYTGRRLTGSGSLSLELLRFDRGAITAAIGELHSGPGEIDAALLYSFQDALGATTTLPAERRDLLCPYGELAVGFSIAPEGVLLRGKCERLDGWMLTDQQGNPGAREPSGRQPIDALVRALAPATVGYVPATRQSEWLLKRLPVRE
jgi:hypothetical protein